MISIDKTFIGRQLSTAHGLVDANELRAFARAIGETRPVHFEHAEAVAKGYRSILAPPTYAICLKLKHQKESPEHLLWSVLGIDGAGVTLLHAQQSFHYQGTICAGDSLSFNERVTDIYEKKGGTLVFVVMETTVVNQFGDCVARIGHTEVARSAP